MNNSLFETVSVPKAYMKLALPVVFSMIVTLIYNMVDTYFIALTGNTALVAGTSLTVPVFTLMIALGDIWGLGGGSLISRLFGAKKDEDAKHVCSFCFWAAIVFGLCVSVIMLIFKAEILTVLGADSRTWEYANDYYTWIVIGAAAIILGLVPSNLLRTEGFAGLAMIGSVMGSVINIVLDPIFIFGLNLGAAGAAIATVIGNIAADLFYAYAIVKKSKRLSISLSYIKISRNQVLGIFAIGIPASITNLMQSFMIMMTNHYLLPYGTDKIAAMGIALKANMISGLILVGFAFGGQPLIGYNYGAHNSSRLKEILKFAYIFEIVVALCFTVVMAAFAPAIISVFMKDTEVVVNGALMLRFLQFGMVFMAVTLVSTCICQSIGNAGGAFILSISRQGLVFAAAVVLLSNFAGYYGVLSSQLCADAVTAIIAAIIIIKADVLRKTKDNWLNGIEKEQNM